jgi:peptidoglycan/LPS O-acetylase OafA/YrhL
MKTGYLAEVDGLRAVAVLLVVLFHLGFDSVPGGFIGVDVFFVVSGFLITRLIREEILASDRFSFSNFYMRRARRLFPAFFFTLALTCVAAFLLFSPAHLERFGGALVHTLLGASNVYFWLESGYFDVSSTYKPLLHTWSLSVEEQFYLVWPLTLLIFFKVLPGRFVAMALLCVVVAGISMSIIFQDRVAATFYWSIFRAYEFGIGALMVWAVGFQPRSQVLKEALIPVGLALIVVAALRLTENTRMPSYNALLPCVGAALVILGSGAPVTGRLLRNRLFVGVGLISYSLYLAHWPIIVFFKYWKFGKLTLADQIGIMVVSVVAAWLMYLFIERPFRQSRHIVFSWRPKKVGLVFTSLALLLLAPSASMWASGWAWRADQQILEPKSGMGACEYPLCVYQGGDTIDLVIAGDSHARHHYEGLRMFAKRHPVSFAIFHFDRWCRPLNHPDRQESLDYDCGERLRQFSDFLKTKKVKKVLFSYRWTDFKQGDRQEVSRRARGAAIAEKLNEEIQRETFSSVDKIGLIVSLPTFYLGMSPASCQIPKYLFSVKSRSAKCRQVDRAVWQDIERMNAELKAAPYAKPVIFLDPFDALCDADTCYQADGNEWLYSDSHHLSARGSMLFEKHFQDDLVRFLN